MYRETDLVPKDVNGNEVEYKERGYEPQGGDESHYLLTLTMSCCMVIVCPATITAVSLSATA